jgi:hypothetical protein
VAWKKAIIKHQFVHSVRMPHRSTDWCHGISSEQSWHKGHSGGRFLFTPWSHNYVKQDKLHSMIYSFSLNEFLCEIQHEQGGKCQGLLPITPGTERRWRRCEPTHCIGHGSEVSSWRPGNVMSWSDPCHSRKRGRVSGSPLNSLQAPWGKRFARAHVS